MVSHDDMLVSNVPTFHSTVDRSERHCHNRQRTSPFIMRFLWTLAACIAVVSASSIHDHPLLHPHRHLFDESCETRVARCPPIDLDLLAANWAPLLGNATNEYVQDIIINAQNIDLELSGGNLVTIGTNLIDLIQRILNAPTMVDKIQVLMGDLATLEREDTPSLLRFVLTAITWIATFPLVNSSLFSDVTLLLGDLLMLNNEESSECRRALVECDYRRAIANTLPIYLAERAFVGDLL